MTTRADPQTRANRDDIYTVQQSGAKRFDEIRAPDFYCRNPDGSLVDGRVS